MWHADVHGEVGGVCRVKLQVEQGERQLALMPVHVWVTAHVYLRVRMCLGASLSAYDFQGIHGRVQVIMCVECLQ
jgi:hypothetical protein